MGLPSAKLARLKTVPEVHFCFWRTPWTCGVLSKWNRSSSSVGSVGCLQVTLRTPKTLMTPFWVRPCHPGSQGYQEECVLPLPRKCGNGQSLTFYVNWKLGELQADCSPVHSVAVWEPCPEAGKHADSMWPLWLPPRSSFLLYIRKYRCSSLWLSQA